MTTQPAKSDTERYRENYLGEQEGIFLYQMLAETERDPHLAELYRKIADIERRHSGVWEDYLRRAGVTPPQYTPNWRIRTLGWLARRFGTGAVLPIVSSMEKEAMDVYDHQPEARDVGMPADERSHARVFSYLQTTAGGGVAGPLLARFEGRHRSAGGNQLRAAVLGASDGLTSNLSLVMGVAGYSLAGSTVLVTGLAGLLAGALSMAIGEWLSVQSARELYGHQISIEKQEIESAPEEEQEELALIYQAKGIDESTAKTMAENLMKHEGSALDTLSREELGIDPNELGGSAWGAAITSFFLFAMGAIFPVFPFFFSSGLIAVGISLLFSAVGLFAIGAGITLTSGTPLLKSGSRQVLLGFAAAAITFGLGRLVGGAIR
jgi:vacuolar iron transporter family protein